MKMALIFHLLSSAMEGFFFGSGKAHVVTGVALVILWALAFLFGEWTAD